MHLLLLPLRTPSLLVLSVFLIVVLTLLFRSIFAFGSLVVAGFGSMAATSDPDYIKYTTITEFFLQDDPATDSSAFNYTTTNFGLINRAYDTDAEYDPDHKKTQWQRFDHKVFLLNRNSGQNVQYKLLYFGRHGEGYHNVAETYYGTPAWNCYWSEKDGNENIIWSDSEITPKGADQAVVAHNFWATEIAQQKISTPQSYYTSPLSRCLKTAEITFTGLDLPSRYPFIPVVKELFRETTGVHTCDRRRSKTFIHEHYPTYVFEAEFAENDPLWNPVTRETEVAEDARLKTVLDDVFSHDHNTYISVTAHSGTIASALRVLGHRDFDLSTGAMIPVLVKAETVDGTAPTSIIATYSTVSTCATPPPNPTA